MVAGGHLGGEESQATPIEELPALQQRTADETAPASQLRHGSKATSIAPERADPAYTAATRAGREQAA